MKPTMSMFATKADYDKAMARRDLNPHKAAKAAMWIFGSRYADSGKGSMGFWDSLSTSDKELCRRCVVEVEKAPPEINAELCGGPSGPSERAPG
jgi:hypothetical protein